MNDHKVWAVVTPSNAAPPWKTDDAVRAWSVEFHHSDHDQTMTVPFFTGSGIKTTPTAADVLECLLTDAFYADLDAWDSADELGYETIEDVRDWVTEKHPGIVVQTNQLAAFLGQDVSDVLDPEELARELTTLPIAWGGPAASEAQRAAFYGLER